MSGVNGSTPRLTVHLKLTNQKSKSENVVISQARLQDQIKLKMRLRIHDFETIRYACVLTRHARQQKLD